MHDAVDPVLSARGTDQRPRASMSTPADIPSDDGLQALIEQWRTYRQTVKQQQSEGFYRGLRHCADALEAALRVSPPSSPRPEQEGDQARMVTMDISTDSRTAATNEAARVVSERHSYRAFDKPLRALALECVVIGQTEQRYCDCEGIDFTDWPSGVRQACSFCRVVDAVEGRIVAAVRDVSAESPVAGRSSWSDEQATSPAPESQAPPADPQGWRAYVQHKADCAVLCCQFAYAETNHCDQPEDSSDHDGDVWPDAHAFIAGDCTCGLATLLAHARTPEDQ